MIVGAGAAVGAASRHGINKIAGKYDFLPWQTLGINVVGSFALGALTARAQLINPKLSLFLGTGVCGGFTTYSTFSVDSVRLLDNGLYGKAACYIILSNALSISSAYAGYRAFRLR